MYAPRNIKFFVKVFTETNVNISNELDLSDIFSSLNDIVSLAKFTFALDQCSIHFDKPQKYEIHTISKLHYKQPTLCSSGLL